MRTGKSATLEFPTEFATEIASIRDFIPPPTDGKTRVYCFFDEGRISPVFGLGVNGTVDIDWGDDTTHSTLTGSTRSTLATVSHTYAQSGEYCITITPATGSMFSFMGNSTQNASLVLSKDPEGAVNEQRVYQRAITRVVMGDGASLGSYAFSYCYGLGAIEFPTGTTSFSSNGFAGCYGLVSVDLPSTLTSISASLFRYCYLLTAMDIPDTVTSIGNTAFQNCYSLAIITVGSGVTSIGANAFGNCYGAKEFHFKATTPPALGGTNAFANLPSDCTIYVPYSADHSVLNAYKTETNWATYASQIQEESGGE